VDDIVSGGLGRN